MCKKSLEVENYEHNLTIHYETKRKELDTLLTSSMPNQLSNIKTLLWFNVVSLAIFFKLFETIIHIDKGYLLLASASILVAIFSLLVGREKDYGSPEDLTLSSKYDDNSWTKSQFIIDMLNVTQKSIEFNRTMVAVRAKLMNLSTFFTFISTIYLVILFFIKL
ncbi:MAG: hypothetical protein L3J10_09990 [Sulfurimonas sp.]|nr:hypothetical protein [Sulfurimonas sp.]